MALATEPEDRPRSPQQTERIGDNFLNMPRQTLNVMQDIEDIILISFRRYGALVKNNESTSYIHVPVHIIFHIMWFFHRFTWTNPFCYITYY